MLSGFDHELYPRRVPLSYTKQKNSNYLNSHGEPEAQLRVSHLFENDQNVLFHFRLTE